MGIAELVLSFTEGLHPTYKIRRPRILVRGSTGKTIVVFVHPLKK
jgi:hypothetical protein